MLPSDPFESSAGHGIPFLRIVEKISNALGEFILTIEHDDLLIDVEILFEILSGFSE
jgi:hypothetical protein